MDKKKNNDKKMPDKAPSSKSKNKIIAIVIIAAAIAGGVYFLHKSDSTVDSAYAAIDGIPCETQEYSTYHIHAHLDVFVNGQHVTVPQYVGIMAGGANNQQLACLYWLHTHDTTGIMHIESPLQQNFTLSQFLDVWQATRAGAPPSGEPTIFVNGQEVSTTLANTELGAHDEIAIVYGQTPPNIPSFYQFPEGL